MSTALCCQAYGPSVEKNQLMSYPVQMGWSLLGALGVAAVLIIIKLLAWLAILALLATAAQFLHQPEELGWSIGLGVMGLMGLGLTAGNTLAVMGVLPH